MLDQPDNKAPNIGFNFDNSYATLPKNLYQATRPEVPSSPHLLILNEQLVEDMGLSPRDVSTEILEGILSGQILPEGAEVISQAYAGHQFGNFTNLGDGRAHLLGEHVTPDGQRLDIQFKGSGRTPFSRSGDGKAALGPMLREYIISESLHGLGIPTTRSLAVTTTGEPVFRQEVSPGAVLTRVAASHVRVGTFQYLAAHGDLKAIRALADYVINRHYAPLKAADNPYVELLKEVMNRQIKLITNWMRVGFIHGVMNTDNMLISGETIDYGPCAFIDDYDPEKVFSSIDRYGRYAFTNQSRMAHWNITRFAETLLPLLHEEESKTIEIAETILNTFQDKFEASWQEMMNAKLGLSDVRAEDKALVADLLDWMHTASADYTNTFTDLTRKEISANSLYQSKRFTDWYQTYQDRKESDNLSPEASRELMTQNNPVYIPRNHNVASALFTAEANEDLTELQELLEVVTQPYDYRRQFASYQQPPTADQVVKRTYCGT